MRRRHRSVASAPARVRIARSGDGKAIKRIACLLEQADFEKMAQIRERIDRIVSDRATADALKPRFSLFCKRPCFHDDYLAVFNQPNITLIDTQGRGVEAVTPAGAVVGGVARDRPLGLHIFGDDAAAIEHVLGSTASGGVSVNACALQGALPSLGFGGSGTSGMGRHHGIEGFREFVQMALSSAGQPASGTCICALAVRVRRGGLDLGGLADH